MRAAIEKGTKVVCPLCRRVVGEFARDLRRGEVITPEHIALAKGEAREGEEMLCPHCGFPFSVVTAIGTLIHTERGWEPFGFPTNLLMPELINYLKQKGRWRREWDEYLR